MGPLISLHVLLSESSSATALTWLEVLPGFSCQGQTRDRLWRQVPCCNSNSWKLAFRGPGPFFLCLCLIWLEAYLLLVAALPCFRQGLLCFVCTTPPKRLPPHPSSALGGSEGSSVSRTWVLFTSAATLGWVPAYFPCLSPWTSNALILAS